MQGAVLATVAVSPGTSTERVVPVHDRLFIGRECGSIDEDHRLIVRDDTVSRHHLEIRLDVDQDQAFVIDVSTNGTRLNGVRIERAMPVRVQPGDRIKVGGTELEFRSERFRADDSKDVRGTVKNVELQPTAMVVGDIITYSTISQYTEEGVLLESLDVLYGELRSLLSKHRGTMNNYVGDAFFAVWEVNNDPEAPNHSLRFALDAADMVNQIAPDLPLRDPNGLPIRMGWAAVLGRTAVSYMTGALIAVLGDATNLAFRLSGLSGRDGRGEILATRAIVEAAADTGEFSFGPPEDVTVKGRTGTETVFPLTGGASRRPAIPSTRRIVQGTELP
jgi:adenylate cyclase